MTDPDHDGTHIAGLIINAIHFNWPTLIRLHFLEKFITPIVTVSRGSSIREFYSLPDYEQWTKKHQIIRNKV